MGLPAGVADVVNMLSPQFVQGWPSYVMLGKLRLNILSLYSIMSGYCAFHSGWQGCLMGSGALYATQLLAQGKATSWSIYMYRTWGVDIGIFCIHVYLVHCVHFND